MCRKRSPYGKDPRDPEWPAREMARQFLEAFSEVTMATKESGKASPAPWKWERNALYNGNGYCVLDTDNVQPDELESAIIARAPDMLSLLKELEWIEDKECVAGDGLSCPCCGWVKHTTGHAPDCRLAKLLESLR